MATKPPCPDCGETRWAAAGYCLSRQCAGHYLDPDYPLTAPEHLKWNRKAQTKPKKSAPKPKIRKPRKGALRTEELWYESRGLTPPWKAQGDNHA